MKHVYWRDYPLAVILTADEEVDKRGMIPFLDVQLYKRRTQSSALGSRAACSTGGAVA
jgi:hypothetical protein